MTAASSVACGRASRALRVTSQLSAGGVSLETCAMSVSRHAVAWERIWTVMATCAQQGRSVFDYLCAAVTGYFQGEAVPSLLAEG